MENGKWKMEILTAVLLAVSPWHITVSRATSEVVIALFLALIGFYFFVLGINEKRVKNFLLSFTMLGASYLFYHSARLLVPIFIFAILVFYLEEIRKQKLFKTTFLALAALSLLTLLLSLNKEARARFSQVSIFNDLDVQYELSRMPFEEGPNKVFIARLFHNKPSVYARRFINEYTKYFSSNFFLESTTPKPDR